MIEDFFNSWLDSVGPASLNVSLKDQEYFIQQTSYPLRIVPLIIKEFGGNQLSTRWLIPCKSVFKIDSYF
jgi:hypothetical protein